MSGYFQTNPDLEWLIQESVAGNTFRSFRQMSRQPSKVFREWAASRLSSDALAELSKISEENQYDQFLSNQAAHLTEHWLAEGRVTLRYGPGRKLVDLLFKGVTRYAELPESSRQDLIQWLHVPLDSFSLAAVRRCAATGEFGPPVAIPSNAKMGFVSSPEVYDGLQLMMRRIATAAGVPPICIDLVAWNQAHGM